MVPQPGTLVGMAVSHGSPTGCKRDPAAGLTDLLGQNERSRRLSRELSGVPMQSNLSLLEARQITLITRVTPYAMAGHLLNTTVLAVAVSGSVAPLHLFIWCLYSYSIAIFLLYRHLKNRGRSPRSYKRAARKATIYSFFLALPWSSLAVLHLGALAHDEELILVALGIGMAASGTVLLSAVPTAAFSYMSAILIPSALKCLALNQKGYYLLAALAFSSWGFLAALIAKITRDIEERQKAESMLADRSVQLTLAEEIAKVGSFALDVDSERIQISPGYAAIQGLPAETAEINLNEWRARVHPDDLPAFRARRQQALAERRCEQRSEYRIVLPFGAIRWIESRAFISYDRDGRAKRMVGVNIDVTERKQMEEALAERTVLLALAGKAARVGSYAYDPDSDTMQISEGYAALHGLPEAKAETTRSEWRARLHPEDLARVEEMRNRAFRKRLSEYGVEYRIFRSAHEVRWIESRSFISYGTDGCPLRVVGVNIDVTERRRTEDQQRVLVAELDHRVKNVLATVGAIITQTRDGNSSLTEFVAALDRRIKSFARTHESLSRSHWSGASLTELAQRELAPFAHGNVEIGGPNVTLKSEAAPAAAMVLNELTTNAAKYGAFSNPGGRGLVQWRWQRNGLGFCLVIDWQEIGGPPVLAPAKPGYGTSVIRELVPFELDGKVDLAYARDGVRCRMEIPAKWVGKEGRPQTEA